MKTEVIEQMAKTLITVEEAATVLGVKRQTVYLWVREGLIPCYRVGKRLIRFDRNELLNCFKVERSVTLSKAPKLNVGAHQLAEPFHTLEKTESPEVKKQRERYRAMLGVVK